MQSRLLTFTNSRGESITFRDDSSFIISQITGLGDVDADVQMQRSPYQDGTTYIDSNLQPRPISFTVTILGDGDTDISYKRTQLARIFNPKLGVGTFEYKYGGVIRLIKAVAEHIPHFPTNEENRSSFHQVALVNLICPNPYWQSPVVVEEPAFEPRFRFPIRGPFIMGVQRTDRIIFNDGDAPAPVQVDFYGPADRPMIENRTTGEFIRINKRLEENEILKIDTSDGMKSVVFVDEDGTETNVFHWIDLSSTFFKLDIGENDITCNCAISNNAKDFDIYYSKLYNAV